MYTILFVGSSPVDAERIRINEEFKKIDSALQAGKNRDYFELRPILDATTDDLHPSMLRFRPQIIHFSGHATPQGEILLEDDAGNSFTISPDMLEGLIAAYRSNVRCVVLNSCYTEKLAESISNHIDGCVIGYEGDVLDEDSVRFSEIFYGAISQEESLQNAFELAKNQLFMSSGNKPQLHFRFSEPDAAALVFSPPSESDVRAEIAKRVSPFVVPDRDWKRITDVYVKPSGYVDTLRGLKQKRILWIVGEPGIGKSMSALHLASEIAKSAQGNQPPRQVYRIPRSVPWSEFNGWKLHETVLILPDTLGAVGLEHDDLEYDLPYLEQFVGRDNWIIATSPTDIYGEAREITPRFAEHLATAAHCFELGERNYPITAKKQMLCKALQNAQAQGLFRNGQREWIAKYLPCDKSHLSTKNTETKNALTSTTEFGKMLEDRLMQHWLPIDIDRFVTISLPTAKSESDLSVLLSQDTDIESRIHQWFVSTSESNQCFVLTLALLGGQETSEFWARHKQVVELLGKLDPDIVLKSLGKMREQAWPYVTESGPIEFTNVRVYRGALAELARSYREYFVELYPLLRSWTIPMPQHSTSGGAQNSVGASSKSAPVSNKAPIQSKDDTIYEDTEWIRNTVARAIGEFGKTNFETVLPLLDDWSRHDRHWIGKTAGVTLREVATDPLASRQVMQLLNDWSQDRAKDTGKYRRWTAAAAAWQVGTIPGRPDLQAASLNILKRLAGDSEGYVQSSAAFAVKMMASSTPFERIEPILSLLAESSTGRDRDLLQRNIANALDVCLAKATDRPSALLWIDSSLSSGSSWRRWTACHALLSCTQLDDDTRFARIAQVMETDPSIFVDTLLLAAKRKQTEQKRLSRRAKNILPAIVNQIATEPPYREAFIQALTQSIAGADMTKRISIEHSYRKQFGSAPLLDVFQVAQVAAYTDEINKLMPNNPTDAMKRLHGILQSSNSIGLLVLLALVFQPNADNAESFVYCLATEIESGSQAAIEIQRWVSSSQDIEAQRVNKRIDTAVKQRAEHKRIDNIWWLSLIPGARSALKARINKDIEGRKWWTTTPSASTPPTTTNTSSSEPTNAGKSATDKWWLQYPPNSTKDDGK